MAKKRKFSVHITKEYIVVAEDEDQARLKVQQKLQIPIAEFINLNIDSCSLDMNYERMCNRGLYDGVDIK